MFKGNLNNIEKACCKLFKFYLPFNYYLLNSVAGN